VVYIAAEDGANGIPEENEDMEQSRIEESVSVSFVICAYIRVSVSNSGSLSDLFFFLFPIVVSLTTPLLFYL
jgi:hypothetical protein